MGVGRGVAIREFAPLEIGTKNHKFLENMKLVAKFRLIHLIVAMTVYFPVWRMTLTLHKSQVHCSRVMQ